MDTQLPQLQMCYPDELKVGDICRTNCSQLGGLVKVLQIAPYAPSSNELSAWVEHIEDHPYGYKKGDQGWYLLTDLVRPIPVCSICGLQLDADMECPICDEWISEDDDEIPG